MSATTVISTVDNITLVTLQEFPANVASIAKVLEEISKCGINIDMISMAPTHGATTGLSFTISDEDMIDILGFTSKLKQETDIDVIVSTDADIRLITTSEVEISLLVTEADFDTVLAAIQEALL